jgi:ubiquinone/menaquinone biosynthesis C-methylase UbiE
MSARSHHRGRSPDSLHSGRGRGRTSSTSPEAIVRRGWNRLSKIYRPPGTKSDSFRHTDRQYREWLSPLAESLSPGAPVLDLGCGTGEPASRELAKQFDVLGVDLSDVMIRRARKAVPSARFVRADVTKLNFPPETFGAVVSLYAIIHVPLAKQKPLLGRIYRWLRPRGLFLAVLGHEAWQGTEQAWLGVEAPMFWSHADAATYRKWLRKTGFVVIHQKFIPEGNGGHELFLARKRSMTRP